MPQIQGNVTNVGTASNPDGTTTLSFSQGRAGELIDSNLHQIMYQAAYRGCVQWLTTATAGTTIPIQAGSLASTFTVWNPAGSGKNLELIRYSAAFEAATMVVSDVSLYFQTGVGSSASAPTVFTAITATRGNGILGGGLTSVASTYSAATLIGAISKGPTLFGPTAANTIAGNGPGPSLFDYIFYGTILVPPGTIITTAGNAAQSQATSQTLIWAEWPI